MNAGRPHGAQPSAAGAMAAAAQRPPAEQRGASDKSKISQMQGNSTTPQGPDGATGESLRTVVGDWTVLVRLFERSSPVSMSHWNPLTGKVFELPRGKQRKVTGERFERRLMGEETDAAEWAEIPCEESDTEYRRSVAFAEELRPGAGRAELLAALHGLKPFRAFRAVLARHPGLERRWAAVATQAAEERLAEFCLAQGWRLADPRFDQAVERWLDAEEAADGDSDQEAVAPVQLVMRTAGQLSLGRRIPPPE